MEPFSLYLEVMLYYARPEFPFIHVISVFLR